MPSNAPETTLLGQFIPLHYHYQMLLDQARMDGFEQAIQLMVPSGGKVVELGGGTGVLSFFAAKKASKVWCVEHNLEMVEAARRLLELNGCHHTVEVIHGDAKEFIPPEPVDVVVCEMLHSALLREKQIEVIDAFKRNYTEKVSKELPTFIPEATILAVQAVEQDFNFNGYQAPVPIFFDPVSEQRLTKGLSAPLVYSMFEYRKPLATHFQYSGQLPITEAGLCNALRFVTKNVLAILMDKKATIDWHNFYLVLPLADTISVTPGDKLSVEFEYQAGASLGALSPMVRGS